MNITHITSLTNNFEAAAHYLELCCSNFKRVKQCLESTAILDCCLLYELVLEPMAQKELN